jgi:hypothetical protein
MLLALMKHVYVRSLALLLVLSPLSQTLSAQDTSGSVAGIWLGTLHMGTTSLRDQLHLQLTGGAWTCTIDSLDRKLYDAPCSNVQVSGQNLSLDVPAVNGKYVATLSPDGKTLTGTYTQGASGSLNMERQSTAIPPAADRDFKTELELQVLTYFKPTRFTADRTDILKAGTVLVLKKQRLLMYATTEKLPPTNVYKNGRIGLGSGTAFDVLTSTSDSRIPQRTFVESEKFWMSSVTFADDGFLVNLVSDPYADVRYYGKLKIPYNKKAMPTSVEVIKAVLEVVAPDGDTTQSADAAPAPAPPPAPSTTAPIAPPPPPSDAPPPAPKTIAIGQTKDMVVAILGQPQKIVNLGKKEIDVYPDLKVTFVDNKVSDVQ